MPSSSPETQTLQLRELALIASVCGVTTLNVPIIHFHDHWQRETDNRHKVFLSGALTVALPTIGKALNFKQADLQWPLNVYA
jgi:hypothetical protein